jgi:uncharacterized protein
MESVRAVRMRSRAFVSWWLSVGFLMVVACAPADAASVWKVSAPGGGTLYLGGSVHALRSTDYPLPAAFNRAFEASSHLVFEVDDKGMSGTTKSLVKAGEYPRGDSLKNHVDPRTYAYLKRVFALMQVPEAKWSRHRPWFLVLMLQASGMRDFSGQLGVDQFLSNRAKANKKPVSGLESGAEHAAVYSGLTDRQGEALLLHMFIPQEGERGSSPSWMPAWRRGDADAIAASMHAAYREYPAFAVRILDERNRRWMPKIESYLRSGDTYYVVVGAAHIGGPNGLLAMLRAKGYQITQL